MAVAVVQQTAERRDLGPDGFGQHLGLSHPPLRREPPLLGFLTLLFARRRGGLAVPLALFLGRLPGCLLPRPLLGLGRPFRLPALLRGLPRLLRRDLAFLGRPCLTRLLLKPRLFQLRLLARGIHLGKQRLTSGHHTLQTGTTGQDDNRTLNYPHSP